ncbi:ABC transporter substrate-binding protein [Streptacidiphilus sp. P02-A3a]|uniref:ABC transporter substrate-binding protein n=1 Tax=Streptacidiphilus sp. P02-A3a TaxID=2704468 RepID=UPI0015F8FCA8|nr:ABC transporter substrate-binding protein [Streptacidiphilus sp. P02-A3a]QMU70090.1 ABC transporter substrate-binding protein [Streptacidiphilus sp. P02-A3a]QMU70457.1 ABC transporter substrate-binding protein [Streptacidiphilus sp. P02-A3a]
MTSPTAPAAAPRRARSTAGLLAAALVLLPSAAGCSSSGSPATGTAHGAHGADRGGTLVIGATGTLPDPDTILGGAGYEGTALVSFQIYEGLTRYDLSQGNTPAPVTSALASSWTVAPDHRTWTFTLRKGVTFQDGTAFDAAAVVFNLDRYLKKGSPYYTAALGAAAQEYAGDITSYRAPDPDHVVLVTKAPNGHFTDDLTHLLIASPTAVRRYGDSGFAQHPVGTGPFSFASQTPGQQIDLVANPHYWRGAPKLDKLVVQALPDPAARTAALLSGGANMIDYPDPDDIARLRSDGAQIDTNSYDHIWYWILDQSKAPWNNVLVRQAANDAINRSAIAEDLLHGTAGPAYQAAPKGTFAYDPAGNLYSYDPAKARQLLARAGLAHGFTTTVTVPTAGSGNLLPVPISEAIQQDLAAVGITVKIRTTDWSTLLSDEAKGQVALGSDALAQSTTLFQSESLLPLFLGTGSPFWTGHYSDPAVDRLFAAASSCLDQNTRQQDYTQALDQVTKDAPWLFVVNDRDARALSPKVHGFVEPQSWFVDLTNVWVSA